MELQGHSSVSAYTTTLVVLFAFLILALPTISYAQVNFEELLAEVQALRDEVQSLRAEVRQLQAGGGTTVTDPISPTEPPPDPPDITLGLGDTGEDVRMLQEVLIHLGYDIPAGVTGNFLAQTEAAIIQLQEDNDLPVTGVLDQATLELLDTLIDFEQPITPPDEPDEPEQPIITPGLTLLAPREGLSVNSGQTIQIAWDTTYAPAGALIKFSLKNETSGVRQPILETGDLTGNYDWTLPTNMPGDNEFLAEMIHARDDGTTLLLASKSIVINIFGGTQQTTTTSTTTTTTSSTNYDRYVAFYTGTEFTTCMADYPETVDLIAGWLDDGLLRFEFPWSDVTGAAADQVIVCEGDEFGDEDYEYNDCLDNTTESTCSEQTGCTWFDTFCGDEGYDPITGPGGECSGTDEASCASVTNCYWQTDSSYCYYDSTGGGGGSDTTTVTNCFYGNATINGEPPGYTVWCDENNNCRVGDESGDPVSSEGLVLGEASSCYTSSSASDTSNRSFLAGIGAAFSNMLQGLQKVLGL